MKSMMKKIYFFLSFFHKELDTSKKGDIMKIRYCAQMRHPVFLLSEEGIKNGAARVLFLRIL